MTLGGRLKGPVTQGALLALALLALVLRVAVPEGFMADPTGQAGLVLCTGSGPIQASLGHGGPIKPHDDGKPDRSHMPCAFAGHVAAPTPDTVNLPVATAWQTIPATTAAWRDQTPGRGLAAPPPPSLGPPTLI